MLRQTQQQKLTQKLSPQQIQLMKLLQIPTTQLEERIKEELEENPALEIDTIINKEDLFDGIKGQGMVPINFANRFQDLFNI